MIELNEKTKQDFLDREWVEKLLDVGVNMDDSKYVLGKHPFPDFPSDYVFMRDDFGGYTDIKDIIPTYTVSDLLSKLREYIEITIGGVEYEGVLSIIKDIPRYIFYYDLFRWETVQTVNGDEKVRTRGPVVDYLYAEAKNPIESLASLLIQCSEKAVGDSANIKK